MLKRESRGVALSCIPPRKAVRMQAAARRRSHWSQWQAATCYQPTTEGGFGCNRFWLSLTYRGCECAARGAIHLSIRAGPYNPCDSGMLGYQDRTAPP